MSVFPKSLLPVEDALTRLLSSASVIRDMEEIGLHLADGRVLARDIAARLTHPAFDNSAMDGYALRHADLAEDGSVLAVIGQSAAGHGFRGRVSSGEAVRIFTGAPVPEGADTVLIQEDAEKLGDGRIRTRFLPAKGRHIRPRGQDFGEGDIVLKSGQRLDFGRLTVAAGMNHDRLPVLRKPKVAILATGDELVPPGTQPARDQIIASNTYGIAALVRDNGADVIDLGIARDDTAIISASVARARTEGADILVTLGGASVGDHDLVQAALTGCGMVLDFWRIAMRPGKPLMVGMLDGMHVLGLPGNPVSSLVCGLLFLEPLTRLLAGLPERKRMTTAVLGASLAQNDKRQDYIRAVLARGPDGQLQAHPFERQDSSMMQIFARADGLIMRPPLAPTAVPGETCTVMMLRDPA